MRIELLNQSKYRHGSRPGDDVPLIVPGAVFAVFDGATDARGTVVDGIAAGRLAALTVSAEMAAIAARPDQRNMPGKTLVEQLSAALRRRTAYLRLAIPPSTTVAAVLDCGEHWRFLMLGDSGMRINGSEVLQSTKKIDEVSTAARVRLFEDFQSRGGTPDEVEQSTRRGILLGLDQAVREEQLARPRAEAIIAEVIAKTGLEAHGDTVAGFLRGGIQIQHRFGNGEGPLAFDTMNGTPSNLRDLIDVMRPKREVSSIELFTDGYPAMPPAVSSAAWEAAFRHAEEIDYHKTGPFATVKGSTSTEFFDDRTVLIVADMGADGLTRSG